MVKFGLSNPVTTDIIGDVIDLKVLVKKYHLAKTKSEDFCCRFRIFKKFDLKHH